MTWVELSMLLSLTGAIVGFTRRRTRLGKAAMVVSLLVLAALFAAFGREFASDFL